MLTLNSKIRIKDRNQTYTVIKQNGDLLTLIDSNGELKYYLKKDLERSINMGLQVEKL